MANRTNNILGEDQGKLNLRKRQGTKDSSKTQKIGSWVVGQAEARDLTHTC